jgi:hypothetical protein
LFLVAINLIYKIARTRTNGATYGRTAGNASTCHGRTNSTDNGSHSGTGNNALLCIGHAGTR